MWGGILAGFKVLAGLVDIIKGWSRKREREEYKEVGRVEQKAADLKARESQASEANAIDEDVRGMSRADIERELRGPD